LTADYFVATNNRPIGLGRAEERLANLAKHKLDFASLTDAFFLDARIVPARASRFKAIGRLSGSPIAVIFAPLGTEALTIISMRSASRKEGSQL
jgi:uncharacterized protein